MHVSINSVVHRTNTSIVFGKASTVLTAFGGGLVEYLQDPPRALEDAPEYPTSHPRITRKQD